MTEDEFDDLLVRINGVAGHKGALAQLTTEINRKHAAGEMTDEQQFFALEAIKGSTSPRRRHDDDPMQPEPFDGIGTVIP